MESELACVFGVPAIPRSATTTRLGVGYNFILLEAQKRLLLVVLMKHLPVSHEALRKFHVRPFTMQIENHCS